ncbi:MAG: restriction endonuclease [Flammeovirgaceae bacterium]|nr:restriction endonuclease [Flammeovirgaceae bacterium]|tara:strand:+ start:938 stop:3589 length:2652 start_codon:yes stop_codon:yes gene_type:complete
MELKPYQQEVINNLNSYLEYLRNHQHPGKAFNQYWEDQVGSYTLNMDGTYSGMRPYQDNVPGAVHVAIKVPTAGGKTFIACNALHSIAQSMDESNPKAVVWLVPWSNLLQQTVNNLSNPDHPYRRKLNSLFGNRVEVYEKDQLLQATGFNPTSVHDQLNIMVFSFSSIRINSKKKEDRKIYQQNGQLEPFRSLIDDEVVLPESEDTVSLINVIRSLKPIVVVDESHNAESDLSVEMLRALNPSFVLDLTATPKKNSNLISMVNAVALKKESMVKLPVIVYNHHKKEEVITSALHLRQQLEAYAQEEEKVTGKYIRPIILFQAQSNIKGKDNTTFDKIKEQLIKLQIPEEQIKIKVSGRDELKDVDLMDWNCPVRYIITINALKEGWDCPFAYILASLADKSSAVDVEQILGRVLRQPYVVEHKKQLLNLSYVLTASTKFNDTLNNIVKGLQESGFSKDDYRAEELPAPPKTDDEVIQEDLFGKKEAEEARSDEDFDLTQVQFNPNEEPDLSESNPVLNLTKRAEEDAEEYKKKVDNEETDTVSFMLQQTGNIVKTYSIEPGFRELISEVKIPQFFIKETKEEDRQNVLFDELVPYENFLTPNQLLKEFKLQDYDVKFDEKSADVYKVDYDEVKHTTAIDKMNARVSSILIDNILAKPKEGQIQAVSKLIVSKLGDMYPLTDQELRKYVERVFENLSPEQVRDIVNNEYIYIQKIKDKVKELQAKETKKQFSIQLDANKIFTKPHFAFAQSIRPPKEAPVINKSLYEREAQMGKFEQEVIMEIAALDNVVFWHRNLERGKGFMLNGFDKNHYPDFIIYTKSQNLILLETKGDYLNNEDSQMKNLLGKRWAEKSGEKYKYFMVFESVNVPDTYTAKSIINVVKEL